MGWALVRVRVTVPQYLTMDPTLCVVIFIYKKEGKVLKSAAPLFVLS